MPAAPPFNRDGLTWFSYWLIGVWAIFLYFIGPATTAIGEDLGLSDAAQGFIGTALAAGMIASAFVGPMAVARWGRVATVRLVLIGMALFAAVLAAGRTYGAVIAAVAVLGLLGALLANTATATLSDHHPHHRARAITEGNATAAWLGVASPLVLGVFLALPSGWRGAALLVGLLPVILLVALRRVSRERGGRLAETARTTQVAGTVETAGTAVTAQTAGTVETGGTAERPGRQRAVRRMAVPWQFWVALVAVAMAVAMEWTVNFWAAALISERTGAPLSAAAGSLAAVTLAIAIGRTFAGMLANRFALARLLIASFALAAVGLVVLLAATSFALSVAGLFLTGLGLSVLFPFAQSQAVALAPDLTDRAVAMTALAAGMALGSAPFLLGVLAGAVGLERAFTVGFVIAAVGIGSTLVVGLAGSAGRRRRSGQ